MYSLLLCSIIRHLGFALLALSKESAGWSVILLLARVCIVLYCVKHASHLRMMHLTSLDVIKMNSTGHK